jgi:hypothetical protein
MTVFTGARAARNYSPQGHGWAAQKIPVWGSIAIAVNPVVADTYELCFTPDRFLCTGGVLKASDMDTNGTETLDLDLGWAANGALQTDSLKSPWLTEYSNVGYQADPDGFLNTGVWVGDAITDLMPVAGIYRPIVLPVPLYFAKKTLVQLTAVAVAATFAAGNVTVELEGFVL